MKNQLIQKLICLIGIFLFSRNAFSQNVFVVPASLQALGNSGVSFLRAEAYPLNPAASSRSSFTFGINYSNRFLLKDLSTASFFTVVPIAGSRLMASYGQFGNDSYQENLAELGLSKAFGEKISLGLLFHYVSFRIAGNDTKPDMLTFTLGLQCQFKNFGWGVSAFNPYSFSVKSTGFHQAYPYCFRLGAHQTFQDKLKLFAQASYQEEFDFCTHWGIQYDLLKQLRLRAGLQTGQTEWSLGFGFLFGRIHTDLAFAHHQYLGFSPSFTLYFQQP
jgi:hypothetical protein